MENKINIKFVKDHYVNESDSLKEILDVSIGDKVEWDGCKWTITDISSTEITIFKVESPVRDTLNISDIKLINLHVTGKSYTIWKTLKDYGKEDKEISFNSAEAADIYRKLKTIKNSFKSVTYNEWFDKLEKFVESEELCNDLNNKENS